jgi:hypothetical protein
MWNDLRAPEIHCRWPLDHLRRPSPDYSQTVFALVSIYRGIYRIFKQLCILQPSPFVFITLWTLLPKTPGVGVSPNHPLKISHFSGLGDGSRCCARSDIGRTTPSA